jgi:hypothetical protein
METIVGGPIVLDIGGVLIGLESDHHNSLITLGGAYRAFIRPSRPELNLKIHYKTFPKDLFDSAALVFDSEHVWRLHKSKDRNILSFLTPKAGEPPHCVAVFDHEFRNGEVFYRTINRDGDTEAVPDITPALNYPLSHILTICLMAQGRGLMVHASGIDCDGAGYLFAGNSGHGKSTMARLWHGRGHVLNDDRIVLRRHNGQFWIHGTPWHGEYQEFSSGAVPLTKCFFLRHGTANHALPVSGVEACSKLLMRSFPPFWDSDGMAFTLEFTAELVRSALCYELAFVPDSKVVDFVRCLKSK